MATDKTSYSEFSKWPAWHEEVAKCKALVRRVGKKVDSADSIRHDQFKLGKLEAEVASLRARILDRCPHPLSHQSVEQFRIDDDRRVDSIHCGLCQTQLDSWED